MRLAGRRGIDVGERVHFTPGVSHGLDCVVGGAREHDPARRAPRSPLALIGVGEELSRSSTQRDPLQAVAGEEAQVLSVGRPERIVSSFGARHPTRLWFVQVTDPDRSRFAAGKSREGNARSIPRDGCGPRAATEQVIARPLRKLWRFILHLF